MKKIKINLEDVHVNLDPFGRGLYQYTAWWKYHIGPVGVVWVIGVDKTKCFIIGSFVPHWARRQGVRTRINTEIGKWCKTIVTASGTQPHGIGFLKGSGYEKIPKLGWWKKEMKP